MKERRHYAYTTSLASLLLLGLGFYQYPVTQLAYAHTFSGDESAAFIATVGVIRTEIRLIDSTVATNASEANEHAKHAVEHLSANDTKELAERNQRIGTDLPKDLSDLENMTANLSATNTTGIAAVRQKVSDTDALLGEALSVRVEPAQLTNATVYGTAVADLLNETLEHYAAALGVGEGNHTNTTITTEANTTSMPANSIGNATTDTSAAAAANTTTKVVSNADYQSAKALLNMTINETWEKTKSLASTSSNSSSINTSGLSKVDTDLNQLKSMIDNTASYSQVATFVYNTIYPDLNTALNLGLATVDANKAIEEAESGEEE
jgi:hypothetical protein